MAGHAHDAIGGNRPEQRAVLGALAVTLALAAAKVVVGLTISSLSVLAQAMDSVVDIVTLGLLYVALRVAAKPADESHHYGHGKAENLAAFTQTVLLGAIVAVLAFESIRRLAEPMPAVDAPLYAIGLLAASIAIDLVRIGLLTKMARARGSDALRASALNFTTDVGTALVALASLVAVRAGFEHADPIGSLLVCAAVAVAVTRVAKRSVDVLMDRAPQARIAAIEEAAAGAPGVSEARRVRVRETGRQLFADVTVAAGRTASLERAHDIAEAVEREIERVAPGTDVVVHVEPTPESNTLVERVHAAASRVEGVHEVHNIFVQSFTEAGNPRLHITLHAKGPASASVKEAHELADHIEALVERELGAGTRVDAHIEPMERTTHAQDVTEERGDIVEGLRDVARDEPDVLDCHEVIVTDTGGRLTVVAHVHSRGDLSLAALHDASERIETQLMARYPDLARVLIHFEPSP